MPARMRSRVRASCAWRRSMGLTSATKSGCSFRNVISNGTPSWVQSAWATIGFHETRAVRSESQADPDRGVTYEPSACSGWPRGRARRYLIRDGERESQVEEAVRMAKDRVVIVGGGLVGMATAYYLAKAGVASTVIERDAIASHASGYAYGGLSPVTGFGIPGPLAEIAQDGMRLHRELAESLMEETGMDVDFRMRSSLALAFDEADVRRLQAALPWQQKQPGYTVRWLDAAEARKVEPRISDETIGAALTEGGGAVEPYLLVLALTRAAEALGVTVRHGQIGRA